MKRINKALAKISVRELVSSSAPAVAALTTHRGGLKIIELSTLGKRKMEALNQLPLSVFRVYYRSLEVGTGDVAEDDIFFEAAIYRNSLMMEACLYVEKNQVHPLVGIGCDEEAFRFFWSGDFEQRMRYVSKSAFALEVRVDLKSLVLDPTSKADMIRDVTQILIADYKWMKQNGRAIGQLADFDRGLMTQAEIAEVMLEARIQTKLVALHTGLDDTKVDGIKRRILRVEKFTQSTSGRIRQAHMVVADAPIHSLLFLTIYMMLAEEPERSVCARAVVIAIEQYRKITTELGIASGECVSSSNGYRLASGVRAGEITLETCATCKRLHVHTKVAPAKCPWCKKRRRSAV